MIVVMLYVFIRKRVIEISTEFFVIKLNSKMCAFSALYEGIGSKQTVQYLHRKKNQDFDQCVRCKYCTVAGGGDITVRRTQQMFRECVKCGLLTDYFDF